MKQQKHIVSLSGGKDSTEMLFQMIELDMQIDDIVFADTTKEFPDMLNHIEKLKEMIYPLKITTVSIDFDYYFSEHIKVKGNNKGKLGYSWPDFRNRWCTTLKIQAIKRYMKKYKDFDIIEYHGIAADEPKRTKKNKGRTIRYPLVELGITEAQALQSCYNRGLDWNGLYEKFTRVSCWCCPLSRIGELKTLHDDFPELWQRLEQMDCKSYRQFRSDYSIKDLNEKFKKKPYKQLDFEQMLK